MLQGMGIGRGPSSLCSEQVVGMVPDLVVVARSSVEGSWRAEAGAGQDALTRRPEGQGAAGRETLLLNIDGILDDRADAYRLHRREKEGSNYLGW